MALSRTLQAKVRILTEAEQKKYGPLIDYAKSAIGIPDALVPREVVFAFISVESAGVPGTEKLEKAWRNEGGGKSQYVGLLQQGTDVTKDIARVYSGGRLPAIPKEFEKYGKPAAYLYGDAEEAILDFFRLMDIPKIRERHNWEPERMAIQWHSGGGTLETFNNNLRGTASEDGTTFIIDTELALKKAEGVVAVTSEYLYKFRYALRQYNSELVNDVDFKDSVLLEIAEDTLSGTFSGYGYSKYSARPFDLHSYVTPEELRKGIIPEVFYITDWHLTMLGDQEREQINQSNAGEVLDKGPQSTLDQTSEASSSSNEAGLSASQDLTNRRRAYVQSLVHEEFFRRRFAARSVPAASGPFNPYPVAGFPGLLMVPGRPILGYIRSVTHNINVAGAQGTTAVSMDSPRYWDEGEVWYWFGGEEKNVGEENEVLWRRFPQWHSRNCVAVNNYDVESGSRTGRSSLDKYYQFMLGCTGIEYQSNHTGKVDDPEKIRSALEDRNPSDFEVSTETLEIKEYNRAIAELDEGGRYRRGTLAHRFFGHVEPYNVDKTRSVSRQQRYNERFGVREYELLVEFLGNRYHYSRGRVWLSGPTFGDFKTEDGKPMTNALQRDILKYMRDLERRDIKSGV